MKNNEEYKDITQMLNTVNLGTPFMLQAMLSAFHDLSVKHILSLVK